MNYLQIEFTAIAEAESEILVALLSEAGFESFEESGNSLSAFIKEEGFTESSLQSVLQVVPVNYTISVIPQQNWNARWEESFEPVIIHEFAAIRAVFHNAIKEVQHEIIITPKMSFGTGHHATTYMMIEQMKDLDLTGKQVLDFGTGTAVLAILAEKMGASAIDAIDNDEWSIENSLENAATNQCKKINLVKAETIATGQLYDVILANINLNVILHNLQACKAVSKKGTILLLSGIMEADQTNMKDSLSAFGWNHLKTIQKGEWICMLAQMN
ncbi:MAG: 50S ribosomal protein L11 methyltransferase [Chitinophagaceae bacterium]|nr:50S ribosomal protein L11 methyltransferase [Chitinophagaceae bacterium]